MKVGTANYNKGPRKKRKHFKLEDGDQVYRILPPLGNLADRGVWSRFYSVHFGYKNTEGKLRTFLSPQVKNHKTKEIEVRDAALDRLTDLKAKLEQSRKDGNAAMNARLNTLVGLKGVYNMDSNHHMNVMNLNGEIGELKIRHRAMMALEAEIKRLRSEGVDPLSVGNGRYFVFTRNNIGRDTTFKVSVYKEKIDVPGVGKVERDLVSVLTPDILNRLETEAFDLDNLHNVLTAEEVAQVVAESDLLSGKSPAVDRFFDQRWKARADERKTSQLAAAPAAPSPEEQDISEPTDDYSAPQATSTPVVPLQTPVAQEAKEALTTTTVNAKAASSQAKALEELSDAEFFAQLGV